MLTPDAADRIEKQLAGLTEAVNKLVLIEERQKNDKRRMDAFAERLEAVADKSDATARKLEKWIDRGIGAWFLAAAILSAFKYLPLK